MTGTADGRPFGATCVELNQTERGITVRGYTDPNGTSAESRLVNLSSADDAGHLPRQRRHVWTYSSATRSEGTENGSTLVASSTGQVVLSEVSSARGTFALTGNEEVTPAGGRTTQTGRTVAVPVAVDVPH